MKTPKEFDEIRPYEPEEVQQVLHELINDRQFSHIIKGMVPWMPKGIRTGMLRLACIGVKTPLGFQKRFMYPAMKYLIFKCTTKCTFGGHPLPSKTGRFTYISNHRDIVLDSAILDVKLFEGGYPTTVEIAIGDNLLIYPWIKKLVRLNKAFTVRRGLSPRELMQSSILMSRYMHFAVNEKQENIWIAQREGRAKDSDDRTQESVLKMLTLGGEGTPIERLKHMHLLPMAISYEYDP
ncbi:MAG: 1-acyl-sn-glycerol-3-phosphate acyltransferase, partial [Bacteroidaceae bacterium]|nr:1-acyl-sn-glycerol-3-phosphate acyltransferase [Bacteroidaceae bacterium]